MPGSTCQVVMARPTFPWIASGQSGKPARPAEFRDCVCEFLNCKNSNQILVTILIYIIVTILCNYNIGSHTKKTEQRPWVAQVNWASEPSGHVADSRPGQKRQTLAKLTDWTKSAPGNTDSTIQDHEPQPVRKEIQVLGFELRSIDDFCCLLHPACGR